MIGDGHAPKGIGFVIGGKLTHTGDRGLILLAGDRKLPMEVRMATVLDFDVHRLDGTPVNLNDYQGKVVLIVNTASECGLTPQYAGLERLHEKYKDRGLAILGFPSNDFGRQEPGTDAEIAEFCRKNYGVDFDMFSKIVVKGPGKAPLYERLTTLPGISGEIEWNFEKFLVGRDGHVIARFKPPVEPDSEQVVQAIEAAL